MYLLSIFNHSILLPEQNPEFSEPIHMLVRLNDGVLPIQPGGRGFDALGLAVFDHFLQHRELIASQTIRRESLSPTREFGFVRQGFLNAKARSHRRTRRCGSR